MDILFNQPDSEGGDTECYKKIDELINHKYNNGTIKFCFNALYNQCCRAKTIFEHYFGKP